VRPAAPGALPAVLPVVLDVDTGVDDALALLYAVASPRLDLRAVTCVGGNTDLDAVLANTAAVLAVAGGADVPVHRGHAHPVSGQKDPAEAWHGVDGLMGCRPGVVTAPEHGEHAVEALARLARAAAEPLTLVPLGPQTNVAALVREHPDAIERLAAVHFMGGSGVGGNVTAAAEFNVHHDPEAAAAVLGCGRPVRMYGLEVFEHVRLPAVDIEALLGAAHPALRLAGRLCRASAARSGTDDACLGDAGAGAALVRPDLLTAVRRTVAVHVGDGPAQGATVVDRREHGRDRLAEGHAVDVFEQVDGPALARHWLETMLSTWS
jgi:pyrimidine-specific ribonucleoside hydrolase